MHWFGLKKRRDEERVFAQIHGADFTAFTARDHFLAAVFRVTRLGSVWTSSGSIGGGGYGF